MRYGYFDDANREYVIERPDVPVSWTNYLGREDMCTVLSHNAGGYSFYKSAERGRITRRSWWGRSWDLESPTFAFALTSDLMPRRWTLRIGNEPVGHLSGGLLSYNRLTVRTDVAVQVLPLVLAWHVLARPWEAAAAPGSLIPHGSQLENPAAGAEA